MKSFKLFLLGLAFLTSLLLGQNADPLVYTVGNSYATGSGTAHNYLLWQPGDAITTFGKRFAVYAKNGDASAATPYARISIQKIQTSPSAVQALLKLGEKFDHDAAFLPARITDLHTQSRPRPAGANVPVPGIINITTAAQLAEIMEVAATDGEVLQSLVSLGRAHPGVMMAMGHGFAIQVPNPSVRTYEVREIDGSNADVRVIGRVTLDASTPYNLLAPGRPFPVPHPVDPALQLSASAKDHLNVRLRWGQSNPFRETLAHTYGFNLYRVPAIAVSDPALITTEDQALLVSGADRVNQLPIAASDFFTDAEAADLSIKSEVFFYADDKDLPNDAFVDGEQYYYYVAARDIAGIPGPLSPPTLVTMCDRLPPSQPVIFSVDNNFDFANADPATGTGPQNLRIVIQQVPETPVENAAKKYRIYRWHSATDWQRYGGDPNFNFIGEVDHVSGQQFVIFDDDDVSDTDTDYISATDNGPDTGAAVANGENDFNMGKTFWYTVRAEDDASCNPKNLSGHSGALYGVLRDRVGPAKPSGFINRCFCIPRLDGVDRVDTARFEEYGLTQPYSGFIVRVTRTDPKDEKRILEKIRSFEVEITQKGQQGVVPLFSRTYYFRGSSPFGDVIVPIAEGDDNLLIRVRARLADNSVSGWVERSPTGQSEENRINRYVFNASIDQICRPVSVPPGIAPPGHFPVGPDGRITGITGTVNVTPTSREVRVYRRVGHSAPLQLIYKTAGDTLPASVDFTEGGPVVNNGVEVCYYGQLFDEHGNGSPLVRIGCATIVNDDLATPLMTDPEPLPPLGGKGIVRLSWFCDPVGIERFEVWIADTADSEPSVKSADLTSKLDTGTNPVLTTPEGDELTFCIFQTKTIASGFGNNGAEFSITLQVPMGREMCYAIRPVGPMVPDGGGGYLRAEGAFSNIVCSAYVIPAAPGQPVVPWPARPLPGTANITQAVAQYTEQEGPFYATNINPELMRTAGCSGAILVGKFPGDRRFQAEENDTALFPRARDPEDWLFHYRKQAGETSSAQTESILRFVIYRHQVSSDRFPEARPNLVQITPLIDQITNFEDPATGELRVKDPFFLFSRYDNTSDPDFFVPSAGVFSRNPSTFSVAPAIGLGLPYLSIPEAFPSKDYQPYTMWVRDTMPVTSGANYQYLIVHFSERGEIARVIPTNIISH